ncbi:rRNA pseudouridine synthase [Massilia terrae]|uniref:Dual-specificity RNA pseudouridine synthase RluF n=1 Tax=Massilia terrae TaxID=1811224 RepID=A0ABT2CRC2_9BURK|nr:RNA pseudouridine synthase [Massilia terrae]MCS0656520.1 RNA pseudouridine synthase [Massilia terrae]
MNEEGVRLAKRVAAMLPCSRAEAERYIAGGWVTVDGEVAEDPATRVTEQQLVVLLAGATADEIAPVTILLHKPAGLDAAAALELVSSGTQEGRERFLKRHLNKIEPVLPLEDAASGLMVCTQDFRIVRKLVEDASRMEQEFVAQVTGAIADGGLASLNRDAVKVSWQSEGRLRIAGKGIKPGQIAKMCRSVGLELVSLKRLRVGRVSLSKLPEGRWRYLVESERF